MNKRGYYIKKSKVDQSLFLFINVKDFIQYLKENVNVNDAGWLKFRIFQREKMSEKFSHNMELMNDK